MQAIRSSLTSLLLLASLAGQAQALQQVGINTTTPTQALDVNGSLRLRSLGASGPAQLLQAQADGTLGLSLPLAATAGLGISAQLAGTNPVTVASVAAGTVYSQVAAAGSYAFVAGATQLRPYDLSTPPVPAYVGNTTTLQGTVLALEATTSALYAATTAGLEVYSLSGSTPLTLARTATLAPAPAGTTSTTIYDLLATGRYLYLAARFTGSSYGTTTVVRIYDLNTPTLPALVSTLALGLATPVQLGADASRSRLLVAPAGGAYQVYGLATPATPLPALLATAPSASIPTFGGGLAVVGGVLYGANNANTPPTLDAYDEGSPADPSQPVNLGSLPLPKAVQSLAVAGNYAYLLTADASSYQLYAVLVAAPALVGLDGAGNLASVAPVLAPGDNLGNHLATRNLNLAGYQLVGNGGSQGLSIGSAGNVGVLTAPTSSYLLDVGGLLRALAVTASGTLNASSGTLTASTSLSTPTITGSAVGLHSPLAAATGLVSSTGGNPAGSGNYTVSRNSLGSYRLTFTGGPLAAADLSTASFVATLADGAGFVTYTTASATNYITVYTSAINGALSDRAFAFSVFLP